MRLLYVAWTDPRRTSYGGEQRTHFIWEGLKKVAEVYTVIPVAHKYQERVDDADKIRWICFERRWTPGWILRRIWSRLFPRIGFPCGYDVAQLKVLYPFPIDGCVVRYVTMASYLRAWRFAPLYLDVDDLLTEAFDSCHAKPLSLAGKVHRLMLDRYQTFVFRHARHLWVANPMHCQLLGQYPVSHLPNIPCALPRSVKDDVSDRQSMLFVGSLNCDQNFWGIDFFLKTYWDLLLDVFPQLTFKIAGGGLPDCYKEKWESYKNVTLLGFVQDLLPLYEECMCVLAPLYAGSGSAIKVLEALFAGRACLATPHAVRGIQPEDCCQKNGILIFRNQEEIIWAIGEMMKKDQRKVMQNGAHELIRQNFSQHQVDESVRRVIVNG